MQQFFGGIPEMFFSLLHQEQGLVTKHLERRKNNA